MVDLTRDVDEYLAEQAMLRKILIEGKTKAQLAEVIALLKAVVKAPAWRCCIEPWQDWGIPICAWK